MIEKQKYKVVSIQVPLRDDTLKDTDLIKATLTITKIVDGVETEIDKFEFDDTYGAI